MYLRLLLLLLIGHATTAGAQDDADVADLPKSLVVPTEQSISIKLTSRDTTMFVYYNLYAFEYADGKDKINAELLVPKHADAYRHKVKITTSVCRVSSFVMSAAGNSIEVEDFIEVTNNGKKQFFNLDPELPQPVFTLCNLQQKETIVE